MYETDREILSLGLKENPWIRNRKKNQGNFEQGWIWIKRGRFLVFFSQACDSVEKGKEEGRLNG